METTRSPTPETTNHIARPWNTSRTQRKPVHNTQKKALNDQTKGAFETNPTTRHNFALSRTERNCSCEWLVLKANRGLSATMATLDVADFYNEPRHFLIPNPNYTSLVDGVVGAGGGLAGGVGGDAGTNAADAVAAVLNAAQTSPILIAFTVEGDEAWGTRSLASRKTLPTPPPTTTWWWR